MASETKEDVIDKDNLLSYDNTDDQETVNDNIIENDNLASEAVTEFSMDSENSHFESNNDKTSQILFDTEMDNNISDDNEKEVENEKYVNDEDNETDEKQNNKNKNNEKENSKDIINNNIDNENNESIKIKTENKDKTDNYNEKLYNCEWDECSNKYEDFDEFIKHLNEEHIDTITKSTEFGCLWRTCQRKDKPNGSRAALRNHVRIHTGEKPYECEYCHRRFTRSDALSKHKKKCTNNPNLSKRKRDEDNDTPHSSKKRASNNNNGKYSLSADNISSNTLKKNSKNKNGLDKNALSKDDNKHSHNKGHRDKSKSINNNNSSNSSSSSKSYKERYRELKAKYRHSLQENMIFEEEYQHGIRQLSRLKLERNIILDNLIKHLSL